MEQSQRIVNSVPKDTYEDACRAVYNKTESYLDVLKDGDIPIAKIRSVVSAALQMSGELPGYSMCGFSKNPLLSQEQSNVYVHRFINALNRTAYLNKTALFGAALLMATQMAGEYTTIPSISGSLAAVAILIMNARSVRASNIDRGSFDRVEAATIFAQAIAVRKGIEAMPREEMDVHATIDIGGLNPPTTKSVKFLDFSPRYTQEFDSLDREYGLLAMYEKGKQLATQLEGQRVEQSPSFADRLRSIKERYLPVLISLG